MNLNRIKNWPNFKKILLLFLIFSLTTKCSISNNNKFEEILAPTIFKLANSQLFLDLGYTSIIKKFQKNPNTKIYIKEIKELERGSTYNQVVLICDKNKYKEFTSLKWRESILREDCILDDFQQLIKTKNLLTGENILACKELEEFALVSGNQLDENFQKLSKLLQSSTYPRISPPSKEICPKAKVILDIAMISNNDTTRIYRINEIESELETILLEILN